MPRAKQVSKRITAQNTVPVLGAAGLSLLAGGASAATVPVTDATVAAGIVPNSQVTLGEEELADVSLSTFYAFDKEATESLDGNVQLARGGCGHGCGGRGCGGCGGRACGGLGCGCLGGCGCGCGCSCCLSWGACRWC